MTNIGVKIKREREKLGVSINQLRLALEVSFYTISKWENGKRNPSPENIKKMEELGFDFTDYPEVKNSEVYNTPKEVFLRAFYHYVALTKGVRKCDIVDALQFVIDYFPDDFIRKEHEMSSLLRFGRNNA